MLLGSPTAFSVVPTSSEQNGANINIELACLVRKGNPVAHSFQKRIIAKAAVPSFMRLPIQIEAIVFRKNGNRIKYLLLKRLPERNGFWQPVTGGVEQGETRNEALLREIKEETGIKEVVEVLEDVYVFEFSDPTPNREYVYGVGVSPSEEIVLDKKEHSEYKWCGFQEAMQLLHWKENKEALRKLDKTLTQRSI